MNLLMTIMNEATAAYYNKETVVSTETFIIQAKQVKDCDFSFYNKGKMLSPVTAPVIFTGSFHAHRTSICYWFHVIHCTDSYHVCRTSICYWFHVTAPIFVTGSCHVRRTSICYWFRLSV